MIDRTYIKKVLELNGLSDTSNDDEIKSVLLSARWNKDDVDTALMVMREDPQTHQTHVDTLHKVFRSDQRLRPETISALLGVDVDIDSASMDLRRKRAKGVVTFGLLTQMVFVGFVLATMFVFTSMWIMKVGFFHANFVG